MKEQAELNRAFFARYGKPSFLEGMVSWAKPSFFSQKLEPKPSQAELSFGLDPTLVSTILFLWLAGYLKTFETRVFHAKKFKQNYSIGT